MKKIILTGSLFVLAIIVLGFSIKSNNLQQATAQTAQVISAVPLATPLLVTTESKDDPATWYDKPENAQSYTNVTQQLINLGYLGSASVGINDLELKAFRAVVKTFQAVNNIPITGYFDDRSKAILPTAIPMITTKPGDAGIAVAAVQELLVETGYLVGAIDGKYGAKTESAIKKVQTINSLPVTGVADPKTVAVLTTEKGQTGINIKNISNAQQQSRVAHEGILSISHFDDITSHRNIPIINLITKGKTIPLAVDEQTYSLYLDMNGATVRVNGNMSDNNLIPLQIPTVIKAAAVPAVSAGSRSAGPRKLSIVLYKYATAGNPPFSIEDVRKNFFEPNADTGLTMSQFLEQSTYGQFSLTGKTSVDGTTDMYGWYTIPGSMNGCSDLAQHQASGNQAIQMAIQDGLILEEDDFIAVGTFPGSCPSGGMADLILTNGQDFSQYVTVNDPIVRVVRMNNMMIYGTTIHEFGHLSKNVPSTVGTIGTIGHSNSLSCKSPTNIPAIWGTYFSSICVPHEYGSPFSVLGGYASGALRNRLFDGDNKLRAGYLDTSNIIIANNSGTYDLVKVNYSDATILRIPFNTGASYIGNTLIAPQTPNYFDIEARDFLSYEQASDTFPHTNVLLVRKDTQLLLDAGSINTRLVAPSENTNLADLGVSITNLGAVPGDPRKVRIFLNYTKPLPQRIYPGINLSVVQQPSYVKVSVTGSFVQPSINIKNNSPIPTGFYASLDNFTLIYPSQLPPRISSVISDWRTSTLSFNPGTPNLLSGETYTIRPLQDLVFNSSDLVGVPRFIYRTRTRTINQYTVDTYLVYGQFTPAELINLGVLSPQIRAPILNPATKISPFQLQSPRQ